MDYCQISMYINTSHLTECCNPLLPILYKTVTLSTGSSTLDQAGSVSISTGTSSGPGSILSFLSGKSFDSIGGSTIMSAGDGANVGGSLLLSGGHDVSTDAEDDDIKTGGIVNIIGGTSTIGNGGLVSIAGGSSAQGVGG